MHAELTAKIEDATAQVRELSEFVAEAEFLYALNGGGAALQRQIEGARLAFERGVHRLTHLRLKLRQEHGQ